MKTVVACELPGQTLDQLRALAIDVHYIPSATGPELREQIGDAGILIIGDLRVSPEAIATARSLQMIVHAGYGPGDIALEEASEMGIFVTNCPDMHAAAVSELAIGLMIALDRRIVQNTLALRDGRWAPAEFGDAIGLAGGHVGLLGFGTIGKILAQQLLALGMRVCAWSPSLAIETPNEIGVEFCNWPRDIARQSDYVIVLPVEEESEALVDASFLENMREGSRLVHVGSPSALDEGAVRQAIEQRGLRVALDTYAYEPSAETTRFRCPLCDLPDVVGTQHQAPRTLQARRAIADEVVRIVRAFVVSGDVINCVNVCERSPATWQLVLRVRDQVGVMASILEAIRADGINAQEVSSRVFTGAKAAWCTVALDERPSTEALDAIRRLPDVLHLELRAVV